MSPYTLVTEPYLVQRDRWPARGRHILAQCDDESVIVYQAYREEIASFAIKHQYFGGTFSLGRMVLPDLVWARNYLPIPAG